MMKRKITLWLDETEQRIMTQALQTHRLISRETDEVSNLLDRVQEELNKSNRHLLPTIAKANDSHIKGDWKKSLC